MLPGVAVRSPVSIEAQWRHQRADYSVLVDRRLCYAHLQGWVNICHPAMGSVIYDPMVKGEVLTAGSVGGRPVACGIL